MTDENLPKKSYQKIVEPAGHLGPLGTLENDNELSNDNDDEDLTEEEIMEIKYDNAVHIATKIKLYCEREMIPLFNRLQATNIFVGELIKYD